MIQPSDPPMQKILLPKARAAPKLCVDTPKLDAALDGGRLPWKDARLHPHGAVHRRVSSAHRHAAGAGRMRLSGLPRRSRHGWGRIGKPPPRQDLAPQLPEQNSQQKGRSPGAVERAAEDPGQQRRCLGRAAMQRAATNHGKRDPPPHATEHRHLLLLYVFLLFLCSEEVSFLLAFL